MMMSITCYTFIKNGKKFHIHLDPLLLTIKVFCFTLKHTCTHTPHTQLIPYHNIQNSENMPQEHRPCLIHLLIKLQA